VIGVGLPLGVVAGSSASGVVVPTRAVFWLRVGLLVVVAWPYVARGVRAIVAAERGREYALAAIAVGAITRARRVVADS